MSSTRCAIVLAPGVAERIERHRRAASRSVWRSFEAHHDDEMRDLGVGGEHVARRLAPVVEVVPHEAGGAARRGAGRARRDWPRTLRSGRRRAIPPGNRRARRRRPWARPSGTEGWSVRTIGAGGRLRGGGLRRCRTAAGAAVRREEPEQVGNRVPELLPRRPAQPGFCADAGQRRRQGSGEQQDGSGRIRQATKHGEESWRPNPAPASRPVAIATTSPHAAQRLQQSHGRDSRPAPGRGVPGNRGRPRGSSTRAFRRVRQDRSRAGRAGAAPRGAARGRAGARSTGQRASMALRP